jgi:signal transduction histidine kinase
MPHLHHFSLHVPFSRGVCLVIGRTSVQLTDGLQRITDVSPRMQAFMETRRLLALAVAFYVVGAALTLGLVRRVELIGPSGVIIFVSVALLASAVFVLRGERQLWAAFLSLLVLTAAVFVPSESAEPWLPVPNLTVSVAYLGVLIASRWWSWVWILVGLILSTLALVIRPVQVVFWAPQMPLGWIVVLQLISACSLLWWTWRRLRHEASLQDEVHRNRHAQTQAAIARQERSRAWRNSAVALHESMLNTIRYLLRSKDPDRQVLAEYSINPVPIVVDPPVFDTHSVAEVIARSRRIAASSIVVTVAGEGSDAIMSPATAGALRVAMVEVIRNAVRHGQAGTVTVNVRQSDDFRVHLTITDDGSGLGDSWSTGIGLHQALNETVVDVGGTVELASVDGGLRIEIELPTSRRDSTYRVLPTPFNQPRLVVAVILIAYVVVSVAYLPFLLLERGLWALPATIAMLIVAVSAAALFFQFGLFFQSGHIRSGMRRSGAILAALVPWLISVGAISCTQESVLPAVLNASGFATLVLVLWLSKPWILSMISIWAAGGLFLISRAPSECSQGLAYAELNTLLVVPLVLGVAYLGVRQTMQARQAVEDLEKSRIIESTQARAWEDFNTELAETVLRASHLIDRVAQGQDLDDTQRRQLICCDARIRAGIQVDPQVTGSTGLLARDLVHSACDAGVTVNVRAIDSSDHSVEIPVAMRKALMRVTTMSTSMVIQVLDDGTADQVSLTFAGVEIGDVRDVLSPAGEDLQWEVLTASHTDGERVHVLIRVPRLVPT